MLGPAQTLAHTEAGKSEALSRTLSMEPGHREGLSLPLLPERQPFPFIPRVGSGV